MFDGVNIFSSDVIWRHILSDLGAHVSDTPIAYGIDFDSLDIVKPVSMLELRNAVQHALDMDIGIIHNIFGRNVQMPTIQAKIIILLYKSGGMSASQLRNALGYSPNATTHAVDTAIYQLRRAFGHEFIKNINGVYQIGKL